MPDNGTYILTNVGFSKNEEPTLLLQHEQQFISFYPLRKSFTLRFSMTERHCIGWRDITTGERFYCPDNHIITPKYEQCSGCQKRTGFNPAFYHATTVSSQQEARNSEPHLLYLVYFGHGVLKVGITHAKRGNARLLEQGARSALILQECSSAHIARHYEAKIARLPGFSETVQLRKKIDLLKLPYDSETARAELTAAKSTIESALNTTFDTAATLSLDNIYFPDEKINLQTAHNATEGNIISGQCVGQLGSLLFCHQSDSTIYLPLKKYIGYTLELDDTVTSVATPAQQISLF